MRSGLSEFAPWCVAMLAFAVVSALRTIREDLDVRREAWSRTMGEAIAVRGVGESCERLRAQIAIAEHEMYRARFFHRQELLVPRALLALHSTIPPGIGIEAVTWRTDWLAEGPCCTFDVTGWAATPLESRAAEAWTAWVTCLRETVPWEVSLAPSSQPVWSRRTIGSEPNLAFRASFHTPPTPIPPK